MRPLLLEQVRARLALGLVGLVDLLAARPSRVPGDDDGARLEVGQDLDHHRGEAVDRVRRPAVGGGDRFRQGEERPVGEAVAVDQEEIAGAVTAVAVGGHRLIIGAPDLLRSPGDEVEARVEEPGRDRHPRRLEGLIRRRLWTADPGRRRQARRRRRADRGARDPRDQPARRRQRRRLRPAAARSAPARRLRAPTTRSRLPPGEDPQADLKDFSTYVFDDTQDVWEGTFDRSGDPYDTAKLVLYSGAVQTGGCGSATSAVGPFYCPADERVYLDLSFYEDMKRQLGASGDFAWAYVIAHEMGHHVQQMTGNEHRGRPAQPLRPRRRQRALGPPGAAGRLLRRRLGQHGVRRRRPRARRPRRGLQRRRGGRRRPPAGAGDRRGRPRHASPTAPPSSAAPGSTAATSSGEPADCDTFSVDQL